MGRIWLQNIFRKKKFILKMFPVFWILKQSDLHEFFSLVVFELVMAFKCLTSPAVTFLLCGSQERMSSFLTAVNLRILTSLLPWKQKTSWSQWKDSLHQSFSVLSQLPTSPLIEEGKIRAHQVVHVWVLCVFCHIIIIPYLAHLKKPGALQSTVIWPNFVYMLESGISLMQMKIWS